MLPNGFCSALALASLAVPKVFTSVGTWTTDLCCCASDTKLGYVLYNIWDDPKYGIHTWYNTDSTPRIHQNNAVLGQRCKNGTAIENCVDIPDPGKHDRWRGVRPAYAEDNCFRFNDGLEVCGAIAEMRINGKWFDISDERLYRTDKHDCDGVCKRDWVDTDQSTMDICTYTNLKTGPLFGKELLIGYEVVKGNQMKKRKKAYWCDCWDGPFPMNADLKAYRPGS